MRIIVGSSFVAAFMVRRLILLASVRPLLPDSLAEIVFNVYCWLRVFTYFVTREI